jgi:hypothetical protein
MVNFEGTVMKKQKIDVEGKVIGIINYNNTDYISLTDIARHKDEVNTDDIIKNWMRNRNTIELLGFWEQLHNPDFKPVEFDGFRKHSFTMTPKKWIDHKKMFDTRGIVVHNL